MNKGEVLQLQVPISRPKLNNPNFYLFRVATSINDSNFYKPNSSFLILSFVMRIANLDIGRYILRPRPDIYIYIFVNIGDDPLRAKTIECFEISKQIVHLRNINEQATTLMLYST